MPNTSSYLLLASVVTAVGLSCSAGGGGDKKGDAGSGGTVVATGGNGGVGGVIGGSGGTAGSGGVVSPLCQKDCPDFPPDPIFDPDSNPPVTAGDIAPFANPDDFTPDAYCVTEPQLSAGSTPGAMLPANWLRPRFKWRPAAGDTLFEIRLSHEIEKNDLVVYTRNTTWALSDEIWKKISLNLHTPITATVRGVAPGGKVNGTRGTFSIAPVNAGGSMVFWATSSKAVSKTASRLVGFTIGSEYVAPTLDLAQVQTSGILAEAGDQLRKHNDKPDFQAGEVQCIGCHVSTPDGDAVVFSDDWPWNRVTAHIDPDTGTVGTRPSWVTDGALALMNMPFQGIAAMSPAQWGPNKRLVVTSLGQPRSQPYDWQQPTTAILIWMDLETAATISVAPSDKDARNQAIMSAKGSAWGELALNGETRAAVMPTFSKDGTKILYTSSTNPQNGHLNKKDAATPADIHSVPFNDKAGGTVTPVAGASDPNFREYYPALSADDKQIAFNRVETLTAPPYYNKDGEIWIVPVEGGTPTRLLANDPPACTGESSPGITNSWAKWSPHVTNFEGKDYYFLIFSSARAYDGQFELIDPYDGGPAVKSSQLYISTIVVDTASGAVTSYPAVYLWNQNRLVKDTALEELKTSNLTPAWDEFRIPPPPPPR
jgi:hypothetical protein